MTLNECIEKLIELKEKGYGEYRLENCEYSSEPYIVKIYDDEKIIEYQ